MKGIILEIKEMIINFYSVVSNKTIVTIEKIEIEELIKTIEKINKLIEELSHYEKYKHLVSAICFIGIDSNAQPYLTINEQHSEFLSWLMDGIDE